MTEELRNEPSREAEEPRAKRAYQRPEITLFGSVEDFTRGAATSTNDAGNHNRKGT